jgi:glycosyltransferase involved in cell wall biosynthesis
MMKILQVIPSLNPKLGGPVEGLAQFQTALLTDGHLQDIACLDPSDAPWLQPEMHNVFSLGPAYSGYYYTDKLVPWLHTNAHRYDCVIINGLWQFTGFGTWLALRKTNIPFFVYPHGMLDPWFKHTFPLKHLKKWLYWPWAEYQILRSARAVLFTSEEERLLARQSFWLYRCQEEVAGYGTSLPATHSDQQYQAAFLQRFPHLRGKKVLLFLSRIHPKKGCDVLIQAFAHILKSRDPDIHLVMAGPDQTGWQAALELLAKQLNVEHQISWTGMLHDAEKWGAFEVAEAFILPSHQENFGIAVTEALAWGVPVLITYKINIWREILADGAGFIADDTLEGTIGLLNRWCDADIQQKAEMGQQAKWCFRQRFEINQVARNLITILKRYGVGE